MDRFRPLACLLLACLTPASGLAAQEAGVATSGRLRLAAIGGAALPTVKVRLAGATRDAVRLEPSQALEASCAAARGVLAFSVGTSPDVRAAPVRFLVDARSDGEWQSVAELTLVAGGAHGWTDRRVELADVRPLSRQLRFRVESPESVGAYWGGVRFHPVPAAAAEMRPPNVILVSLDTLGASYLGSFGGFAAASGNIDSFLSRAFSFRRAYATYPNTLVSHASILSGQYPSTHGTYGGLRDSRVDAELLSTILRRRGYFNVAFTEDAFVSSDFGFDRDFDWYDDGPERRESSFLGDARHTFGRAAEWLQEYGEDSPFLLFVHTYEVHSPYIVRDVASRRIADSVFDRGQDVQQDLGPDVNVEHLHNAGFRRLSPDHVHRLEALHVGEIDYLDRVFADFLRRFEGLDLARRTLLVVVADHGDEFDPDGKIGHGETLDDVVMHVPMAFYWPGRVRQGSYPSVVSLVDVAPTILDLIGLPGAFAAADGRSLATIVTGEAESLAPRPVFSELQKAAATCLELRLSEDCFVGRFVVHTDTQRFESSMIPSYETARPSNGHGVGGDAPLRDATGFHGLLAAYVTGAPWQARAPWRPQAVRADRPKRPAIDDVTKQRLKDLGYDF